MLTIDAYARPESVEEAYAILRDDKDATLVGGGTFLRLAPRHISTAVDLSRAGLGYLREAGGFIEIGAAVTLGELERSELLQAKLGGIIPLTVSRIASVQLRNIATVGGTMGGRYGFSELNTCLLALDCKVHLYKAGEIPLDKYLESKGAGRDVVEKISIRDEKTRAACLSFRNTYGSLPMLCAAVAKTGAGCRIAVGARPGAARLAARAMKLIEASPEDIARAAGEAAEELEFSDDAMASGGYRRELCRVLVARALAEVAK